MCAYTHLHTRYFFKIKHTYMHFQSNLKLVKLLIRHRMTIGIIEIDDMCIEVVCVCVCVCQRPFE